MEETDVIICGGGPTGILLSTFLSRHRVRNIVLEREAEITTDPRGIALDEDGIRILQAVGIYEKIFGEIASSMLKFNFITGIHSNLYKKPMMAIDYSTSEGGTGHVGFICHKQPEMEKALRSCIESSTYSQLRSSCLVTDIHENRQSVEVQYTSARGVSCSLRGKFLVGADGKTGYVRKKYLEPRGILLQTCHGADYDEIWVALNLRITLPTMETHPDFPLWRLGYSPLAVYDLFFPEDFRFLCNPQRPAVCGRFGLMSDRLWRFEFLVHKHENGLEMASREKTMAIVLPYLTHLGSRYGVNDPVQFPENCIDVLRSQPFSFQARSCNKWALGRVVLTGDAAHVFPPFGGQGIASGFRDAISLAWRLALLCMNPSCDHEKMLEIWYLERKQQFEQSLAATITNGNLVTESNPVKVFIRDWYFWLIQLSPAWKRQLEQGPRIHGLTKYLHLPHFPFSPSPPGGKLLSQSYVWDVESGCVKFSDDLIFAPEKRSMFQLLILPESVEEANALVTAVKKIMDMTSFISVGEATVLIQTLQQPLSSQSTSAASLGIASVAYLATEQDFAADKVLCKNRPVPRYYNPHRMKQDLGDVKYVVVRPDRFIYAACNTSSELLDIVNNIPRTVLLQKQ